MKVLQEAQRNGYHAQSIHIGGVYASRKPTVVQTVLGSCIAVCLRDPLAKVGGMNHFMLPDSSANEGVCSRYGVHAMELLINQCMKAGADRRRLEAKVFGGGHVLKMRETVDNVPQSNIRFAQQFLETENIPIISNDLGGYVARRVIFFTDSGRTLVSKMTCGSHLSRELAVKETQESARMRETVAAPPPDDSNITLF